MELIILKYMKILTDKIADKETFEKRIKLCESCKSLSLPLYRCNECGCFMKVKARIKNIKCPKNNW